MSGNRIARVFFFIKDGEMVLLHAFGKKTRKTPWQEVDVALSRKREVQ